MKRFRKIYVEITNICNKHCSFCPETKRAKAFMSIKNFEIVADKISKYTDYIYLHVKGEPLLHPEIKEILGICNKYNLKINISTNGVLLKDKIEILKKEHVPKLNVSLHSFEDDDEQKLKTYIIEVLESCNELAKENTIIRFKLWNDIEKNESNNQIIIELLENMYGVSIKGKQYNHDIKLNDNIFLSIKKPFKWPSVENNNNKDSKCYGLISHLAILVDGTVTACCLDNDGDINLGNIFSENLEDILSKERVLKIIEGFKKGKCIEELCKKCEFRDSL